MYMKEADLIFILDGTSSRRNYIQQTHFVANLTKNFVMGSGDGGLSVGVISAGEETNVSIVQIGYIHWIIICDVDLLFHHVNSDIFNYDLQYELSLGSHMLHDEFEREVLQMGGRYNPVYSSVYKMKDAIHKARSEFMTRRKSGVPQVYI